MIGNIFFKKQLKYRNLITESIILKAMLYH